MTTSLVALAGCSPSDPAPEAVNDAGDFGHRESGAPEAGGPRDGGSADGDPQADGDVANAPDASDAGPTSDGRGVRPEGTTTSSGLVRIQQEHVATDAGGDAYSVLIGAGFAPDDPPLAGNTSKKLGEWCTVYTLPESDTRPTHYVDAGTITLLPSGKTMGPFGGFLGYDDLRLATAFFEAGNVISARGTGAVAPAFALSTAAPSDIVWTSPDCDAKTCTLDRSKGFSLTWTGGDYGWVNVGLSVVSQTERVVGCMFPANAHQASIPAEAFTDWETSASPNAAHINVYPSSTAWVVQGDWAIELSLEAQASGPILLTIPQ